MLEHINMLAEREIPKDGFERNENSAQFMLAEYSSELSQQRSGGTENSHPNSGTSGSSGNSSLYRHLDGAVYISACATKMDTIVFMHKWSVAQFSAQQELSSPGDFIESNIFGSTDYDYRFRLKLFPCGKDEECRGYLSLFLQIFSKCISCFRKSSCASECPSAKLRFRVNFYIEAADGPRGCALNKNVVTINRGRDLGQLLDSGDFSDFTLHVGRSSFKCHKAILSARSPFFQAMFRDQNNQESLSGEVNLEDVTSETMACVLEYIYKDSCSESSKRTLEILAAADRFCLDRLKNLCQEALVKDLSPNNFCERLRAADMYNASLLKWKILNMLQKHRNYIVDNKDWVALENECPYLAATVARHLLSADNVGSVLSNSTANVSNSNQYSEAMSVKRPRLG
uniref:BTB domain-containing protein n=1 Tax=Elaeophora elaphi TaxID=1147741 RepID=A0A0R3S6M2_9BILA